MRASPVRLLVLLLTLPGGQGVIRTFWNGKKDQRPYDTHVETEPSPPRLNEPLTVRCYQQYTDGDKSRFPHSRRMFIRIDSLLVGLKGQQFVANNSRKNSYKYPKSGFTWFEDVNKNYHTFPRFHNGLAGVTTCFLGHWGMNFLTEIWGIGQVKKQAGLELKVENVTMVNDTLESIRLTCTMYEDVKIPNGTEVRRKDGLTYVLKYNGEEVGADGVYNLTDPDTKCGEITCQQGDNTASYNLPKDTVPIARYVLAGCYGKPSCTRGKQFTAPSDTIFVMQRQFIMLQFMVDNLVNGSITVDGVVSPYFYTSPNPIIDTKSAGTTTQVKVTYTEAGICKRTGGFTLNIVAVSDPSRLDCEYEL